MKKNKVFLICIVGAIVFALFIIIMIRKKSMPNYAGILEMEYDQNYATNNDDIKEYFFEFNGDASINMYEYADKASVQDTLMYYYFSDGSEVATYEKIERKIIDQLTSCKLTTEELENNISEMIDILYLLSNCHAKYNTIDYQHAKQLADIIMDINDYVDSCGNECVEMYIYKWKIYRLAQNIGMDTSCFSNWNEYEKKIFNYDEEKCVLEIAHVLFENNANVAVELCNRYTQLYQNNNIDIETYIVYMGLLSDMYSSAMKNFAKEDIYEYCINNFYSISPMMRFLGLKAVISDDLYKDNIIMKYSKMPRNEEGMLSTTCIIMPTYRRLYSYIQICKVMGIKINKEGVENWIKQIDASKIRVEDLFYTSLIFEEYPEYELELNAEMEELSMLASQVEIGQTNSFNVYSILKAFACEEIDAGKLYENYMLYFKENAEDINEIEHLWKMELEYLYEKKDPDIERICRNLKTVQEEIKIEYFYYALNLMLISENEINEEWAEYILSETNSYRVDGGYYANEEFRYVDIYRTYQCLFIENKIGRGKIQ